MTTVLGAGGIATMGAHRLMREVLASGLCRAASQKLLHGHHDRSCHLAAPGTFIYNPLLPPEGPTPAEAVRSRLLPPLPYTCLGEAPIEFGELLSGLI